MINTIKHLCYVLKSSPAELEEIIANIDNYYYEKVEITANKKRILHPSKGKLKQIQHMILHHIFDCIVMPDYVYGSIKSRNNVMNARRHQGKKFIFTMDLRDFFPSINHLMAFEMLRSRNFSPTTSRILTQLTTYQGHLPQGVPTSSMMANLIFIKTGDKLDAFSKQHDITFTTFIDDLTFSSSKDFKDLTSSLLDIIKLDNYRLNHNKINYRTKNPIVTGVLVNSLHK
jgi:RNA-directed DNA polymerase